LGDSEAVRASLREAAARRGVRSSIVAEAQRLAGDDADLAEMRAIRQHMAALAPEPSN
jgi:Arc/MetJ-type ribon-helix-helix transcriptional regulator